MFKRPAYSRTSATPVPATRKASYAASAGLAVPKEPVKAKPGKRAPTVEESAWIKACIRFGCVACWLEGKQSRPTAYHHIVEGGRRLGHLFGFGLCDPGHHQGGQPLGLVSRHPYKARFEAKYGKETNLLELMREKLK